MLKDGLMSGWIDGQMVGWIDVPATKLGGPCLFLKMHYKGLNHDFPSSSPFSLTATALGVFTSPPPGSAKLKDLDHNIFDWTSGFLLRKSSFPGSLRSKRKREKREYKPVRETSNHLAA